MLYYGLFFAQHFSDNHYSANLKSTSMKPILLLLVLALTFSLQSTAQSAEAEYQYLLKQHESGQISTARFQNDAHEWVDWLEKYGDYPNLPVNDEGRVSYSLLIEFPEQISQKALFHHSLEWLALNLQILPNQLYSNEQDGKIIFNLAFPTETSYDCNYTGILTIRDGKILCEFINLAMSKFIVGHYSGDSWVGDQNLRFPIESYYPVVTKRSSEWKASLDLFKLINERLLGYVNSLSAFHENYETNNSF